MLIFLAAARKSRKQYKTVEPVQRCAHCDVPLSRCAQRGTKRVQATTIAHSTAVATSIGTASLPTVQVRQVHKNVAFYFTLAIYLPTITITISTDYSCN